MLKNVTLQNVGPLPDGTIELGSRLTILTGDNGLGKSFLLDILWYVLTGSWPAEVNPRLGGGRMARPHDPGRQASIAFALGTSRGRAGSIHQACFDRLEQRWQGKAGRPHSGGLVIYAHADGSFSAWDPARNQRPQQGDMDLRDRQPAFVLSSHELWNGSRSSGGGMLCNGLLHDWNLWQSDPDAWEFHVLGNLLKRLSPPEWTLQAGRPARIAADDPRDIPTIAMQCGDVPVLWVSAGIQRMLAFAYILVWALGEHIRACRLLGIKPSPRVTFLMDDVEAHLHPRWQRVVMKGILGVLAGIPRILGRERIDGLQDPGAEWNPGSRNRIQLVAATHSPLIMASLEGRFDPRRDKWCDLDLEEGGRISLEERPFIPQGGTDQWLQSHAFDLPSAYSAGAEKAIEAAAELCRHPDRPDADFRKAHAALVELLNPLDRHLLLFRECCERRGIQYR